MLDQPNRRGLRMALHSVARAPAAKKPKDTWRHAQADWISRSLE